MTELERIWSEIPKAAAQADLFSILVDTRPAPKPARKKARKPAASTRAPECTNANEACRPGLTLKKGFRFLKGGRIVKAKAKAKPAARRG